MPASLKDLTGQESASFGKTGHEIVVEGKVEVAQKLLSGSEEEVLEGVTCTSLVSSCLAGLEAGRARWLNRSFLLTLYG
jgi:hypothetical protein